jgi:hypothetical protein
MARVDCGALTALIGLLSSRGKERETAGIAAAAAGRRGNEEEKRKGGGRKLTGGTQTSAREKKRKEREMVWAGAGRSWWAGRPAGPKGKEVPLFFFLFLFQTFSNSNLFFSNSNQILSNFSQ